MRVQSGTVLPGIRLEPPYINAPGWPWLAGVRGRIPNSTRCLTTQFKGSMGAVTCLHPCLLTGEDRPQLPDDSNEAGKGPAIPCQQREETATRARCREPRRATKAHVVSPGWVWTRRTRTQDSTRISFPPLPREGNLSPPSADSKKRSKKKKKDVSTRLGMDFKILVARQ